MIFVEVVVLVLSAAAVLASLVGLGTAVLIARQHREARGTRFVSGWIGALSLLLGLPACAGVSLSLWRWAASSALALSMVIAANVLAQPFLLFLCYASVSKIILGLAGRVGYAARAVPEEQLRDLSAENRRTFARFSVRQGLVMLPVAATLSRACAAPLFYR